MAKMNYIRGSFTLEANIADTNEYYNRHKPTIDKIIAWAEKIDVYVAFGTSDDRTYLCEYEVRGRTKTLCRSLVSELKTMLKQEWKRTGLGYQASGYYY